MSTTPSTLASKAESQFQTILATHFDQATKAKAAYRDQVKQIHANEMTSSKAKELEQEQARTELLGKLEAIKSKQDAAIGELQQHYSNLYRGRQPEDAGSVRLRRDAIQAARALTTADDMQSALDDAIHNNDPTMAHAVGHVSRGKFSTVWNSYAEHFPKVASASAAMLHVQARATDQETNLANSITYSATNVDE